MVQVSSLLGAIRRRGAAIAGAAIAAAFALAAQPAAADTNLLYTAHDGTTGVLGRIGALSTGSGLQQLAVEWTQTVGVFEPYAYVSVLQRSIDQPAFQWTLESAGTDGQPGAVLASGDQQDSHTIISASGDRYDFGANRTNFRLADALAPGTYFLVLDGLSADNIYWVGAPTADVSVAATPGFKIDGFYEYQNDGSGWRANGASYSFDLYGNPVAAPEPGAWALMLLGLGIAGAALRARRAAAPRQSLA